MSTLGSFWITNGGGRDETRLDRLNVGEGGTSSDNDLALSLDEMVEVDKVLQEFSGVDLSR